MTVNNPTQSRLDLLRLRLSDKNNGGWDDEDIEFLLAEIDLLTSKGEELCCAYGNSLIKIHDLSEALRRIEEIASEDMPNSGWGVYSTVNDIHKLARKALQ